MQMTGSLHIEICKKFTKEILELIKASSFKIQNYTQKPIH